MGVLTLSTGTIKNSKTETLRSSPLSVQLLKPSYFTITNVIENYTSAFLIHRIIGLYAPPLRSIHRYASLFYKLVVIDPDNYYSYNLRYN